MHSSKILKQLWGPHLFLLTLVQLTTLAATEETNLQQVQG